MSAALPLEGVRVIEFSHMIMGPSSGLVLGDLGAFAAMAALIERGRTGRGQFVQSALFENNAFLVATHMAQFAVTGKPAAPMPARLSAWAVYEVFETADAEQIFVGVVSDTQWRAFCDAFALPDLLADPALATNPLRVGARATGSCQRCTACSAA